MCWGNRDSLANTNKCDAAMILELKTYLIANVTYGVSQSDRH